ncbi:50S ribosomal subunit assembly factor BipA [Geodia barretti]|uniref:50S ribosomal subunit assembly factor BipA n=1 Tax=Geodia barretti TaxID=519541 RepID=A0AA35RPF9_GEOBA|nr:50S ribosomal subunit assembly factor BipA [Geodia barretti]
MAEDGAFEIAGRGELQLAVLIETMRREGFELSIGRPRVLMREDPAGGAPLEPIEEIQIDVDEAFVGDVVSALAERRAELIELRPSGRDKGAAPLCHGQRARSGDRFQWRDDHRQGPGTIMPLWVALLKGGGGADPAEGQGLRDENEWGETRQGCDGEQGVLVRLVVLAAY